MAKDKELREKVDELKAELRDWQQIIIDLDLKKQLDLVECEVCGALLCRKTAIRGKSEVREKETGNFNYCWVTTTNNNSSISCKNIKEEYIHTPYFCKKCQPKKITEKMASKFQRTGKLKDLGIK